MLSGCFCLFLLTAFFTRNGTAQTARQLLDSAAFYKKTDLAKLLHFGNQAFALAAKTGDSNALAQARYCIGLASYLTGDRSEALRQWLEAARRYERLHDTAGIVRVYNELIVLYTREEKFPLAADVSSQTIQLAAATGNDSGLATAHNNRGLMFLDQHRNDSAIAEFRHALRLYEGIHDLVGQSYSEDYLASAFSEKGLLDESMQYLQSSRALRIKTGDKNGEAMAVNNIGELLLMKNHPAEALKYFREARAMADSNSYKFLAAYTYSMEAKALRKMARYQEAYNALDTAQQQQQEIQNSQRIDAIEQWQAKYETEKKERRNEELQQQNKVQALQLYQRNLALGGSVLLILLTAGISYLLYNRYRLRQRAKLHAELMQQQQLRTQAILDAEENERQRLARELHDGVGQMLSAARRKMEVFQSSVRLPGSQGAIAEESVGLLDESIREVRQLSHSMMPPALRNKSLVEALDELVLRTRQTTRLELRTDWVDTAALTLDKAQTLMLYRAVQEIIANVIKHADATALHLELVNHDTELTLMVYDNGRGFDKAAMAAKGGLGLKNIESRIAFIGGTLELDTSPGKGATYIIELPLSSAKNASV